MRRFVLVLGALAAMTGCDRSEKVQQGDSVVAALPPGHVPIEPSAPTELAPLVACLSKEAGGRRARSVGRAIDVSWCEHSSVHIRCY